MTGSIPKQDIYVNQNFLKQTGSSVQSLSAVPTVAASSEGRLPPAGPHSATYGPRDNALFAYAHQLPNDLLLSGVGIRNRRIK